MMLMDSDAPQAKRIKLTDNFPIEELPISDLDDSPTSIELTGLPNLSVRAFLSK